jgi:hypothetical protein
MIGLLPKVYVFLVGTGEDHMADEAIKLGDFINPNSMITPGAAGGITMAITNVLTSQFDGLPGNWTALILSFLFGTLTFAYAAGIMARVAYFVINSLIIFVVAYGSNGIGLAATRSARTAPRADMSMPSSAELTRPSDLILASLLVERTSGGTVRAAETGRLILVQQVDDDVKKDKGYFKDWSWGK